MADSNTSTPPQQKFLSNNKMDIKSNNKHVNVIHRTTSESLRIGGDNVNSSDKNLINHPPSTSLSNATLTNSITRKPKTSSFQITSVTVGTRMSADNGDDSNDDLDESHTDDNSRSTVDVENETPSFSEDTFSKEDVFFSNNPIGTAPVIPTSSQYGLAIVAPPESSSGSIDMHVSVTDAGNIVNIVGNSNKHDDFKDLSHRNERFKVVKIESTEPFKRGRWMCMDYLDHTTLQQQQPTQNQNNIKEVDGGGGLTNDSGVVLNENNIDDTTNSSTTTGTTTTGTTLNTDIGSTIGSLPNVSPGQSLHQTIQNQIDSNTNHTQSMINVPIVNNNTNNNNNSNNNNNNINNVTPQTMPQSHLQQIISEPVVQTTANNNQTQTVPTSQAQNQVPILENNIQPQSSQPQQQQTQQYYTTQQGSNQQQQQHHVQGATLPANIIHGIGLQNSNGLPSQNHTNQNVGNTQHQQAMSMVNINVHDNSYNQIQQQHSLQQDQQSQSQTQQQSQQQQQQPIQGIDSVDTDAINYSRQTNQNHTLIAQQSIQEISSQQQSTHNIDAQQQQLNNTNQEQQNSNVGGAEFVPTLSSQSSTTSNASTIIGPIDSTNVNSDVDLNIASGGNGSGGGSGSGNVMDSNQITTKNDDTTITGGLNFINQGQLAQLQQQTLTAAINEDGQPTEDSESASGTSAVAIDNKIEQAMDLVKSHLMFAVREEVEVLKEKIAELMDRINQLEIENTILKANASQETLSQLSASVASTKVPPANPTSGSVS